MISYGEPKFLEWVGGGFWGKKVHNIIDMIDGVKQGTAMINNNTDTNIGINLSRQC